ncbi:hypothetical protein ACJRO7_032192 [Eucalyptus globulus]|uniref:Uncharacterized protein n=1 Tax=Eucalyptus globulus TaxID=34317 RepID=A0ABD3JJ39_EUCGL
MRGANEGRNRTDPDHDGEDVWRRRVRRESLDQAAINYEAARESIIQSLNEVVFKGDGRSSSQELDCVICMEEVATGDQLVRMDWALEFRKNCIEASIHSRSFRFLPSPPPFLAFPSY